MARHIENKRGDIRVLIKDYALKKTIDLSEQIDTVFIRSSFRSINLYCKLDFKIIELEYRNTRFIDLLKINRI